MWQVVQQRDIMHYGKLEEFVTLVTEAVPELLSYRQRSHLILALRARSSDVKVEVSKADFVELVQTLLKDPAEREHFLQLGPSYDSALQMLVWEFLSRLEQLLPVPDLKQVRRQNPTASRLDLLGMPAHLFMCPLTLTKLLTYFTLSTLVAKFSQ
ncbi:hypothetical protein MATL_G00021400 [Megalops atlanticus]|uniref:TERF1-interacting nuclear factor 2 N-terminal domain-containing protein n=1 Tax=Megalops atlanticus TaxID=7932 RepID=A0A9D3QET1_MEGAT|nr:hypothetical protein MATL_G00021400 [Megalops atlanticus]